MSRRKGIILIAVFMIIIITVINLIGNKFSSESNKKTNEYFENLDLKVTGVICGIEKQTDTYKFLITLKKVNSNYKDYLKPSSLGAYFCITKGDLAIFADHSDRYKIGDSIIIGENKTDLIKCVSKDGKVKFIKKRKNAMLYTIVKPNKRMDELIKMGCE
ncbi:hypothetical protein [uncultured Winogradskyella sp.]|uniref:hypothetical protein n=1 Tax=uncultured Winogradskyella sp. TaxID=395353 RepID=UPI00261C8B42|nr:hypothetical protein [uncultured Winogradskyella sp.]